MLGSAVPGAPGAGPRCCAALGLLLFSDAVFHVQPVNLEQRRKGDAVVYDRCEVWEAFAFSSVAAEPACSAEPQPSVCVLALAVGAAL